MNISYVIYQAERTKTTVEQREIDRSAGELAATLARRWQTLAALGKDKHPSDRRSSGRGRSVRAGQAGRVGVRRTQVPSRSCSRAPMAGS
jgi:hypothetical protein